MNDGTTAVGGGLLPPVVDHGLPQDTGGVLVGSVTVAAKPLKAGDADPPESALECAHWLLQKVAAALPAALTSPTTNAPRLGNANTNAVALAADGR
jgi:hypothetical protein